MHLTKCIFEELRKVLRCIKLYEDAMCNEGGNILCEQKRIHIG